MFPLQAWCGPRGWVEVQLYSSMTAALEEGEWSAACPDRTLPPGKTWYLFYRRLGGPQGRSGRAENVVPTGIRSRTVQPIVNRYTDSATNKPINKCIRLKKNLLGWRQPVLDLNSVSPGHTFRHLQTQKPIR